MKYNIEWLDSIQSSINDSKHYVYTSASSIFSQMQFIHGVLDDYKAAIKNVDTKLMELSKEIESKKNRLESLKRNKEKELQQAKQDKTKQETSLKNVSGELLTTEREYDIEKVALSNLELEKRRLEEKLKSIPNGHAVEDCKIDGNGNVIRTTKWVDPYVNERNDCKKRIEEYDNKITRIKEILDKLKQTINRLKEEKHCLEEVVKALNERIRSIESLLKKINEQILKGRVCVENIKEEKNKLPDSSLESFKMSIYKLSLSARDVAQSAIKCVDIYQEKGSGIVESITATVKHISCINDRAILKLNYITKTNSGILNRNENNKVESNDFKMVTFVLKKGIVHINYNVFNKDIFIKEFNSIDKSNKNIVLYLAPNKVTNCWDDLVCYLHSIGFNPIKIGGVYKYNINNEVIFSNE
ncbi:MAG: hypothetical protein K5765_08340 [Clostridia bacterium]|nr:hypothetical protein [Clostridia bacterium]